MIAKLPSGYRQVEYIQSSGTQYVDTEAPAGANIQVCMDFVPLGTGSPFGAIGAMGGGDYYGLNLYNSAFEVYWGKSLGFFSSYSNGQRYNVSFNDPSSKSVRVNGTTVATLGTSSITNKSIYLFTLNVGGTSTIQRISAQIYSCQIYDNGTLVRDYIPCINPSGVVGLYDLVNAKFYGNAGTGVFTAGRKVYSESEITKLEYIESNGKQWVDTEFTPNQDTRVVMDCEMLGFGESWSAPFSTRNDDFLTYAFGTYYGKSGQLYDQYNDGVKNPTGLTFTGRRTIDKNKNVTSITGIATQTHSYAAFTAKTTLGLLVDKCPTQPLEYFFIGRVYSCQIYDNDWLVRDYYPATVDGEIGLWDAESGVLYTDAAGGTFIAGPVLITLEPPENLAAVITEAGVVLTWGAAKNAMGYKVYRDMLELAETAETTYTDSTIKPNNNYIYGVSAYDAETETAATEISVYVETPYSPLELVTDRTSAALARVIELSKLDYKTEMTEAEQEEWRDGMKGAYNAADLNRVEKAVEALAKLLRELVAELKGYASANQIGWDAFYAPPFDPSKMYPSIKKDWTVKDIPTPSDMERYLNNVKILREAMAYDTEALPAAMEDLTWQKANAIEKALFALDGAIIIFNIDVRRLIDNAAAARFYSGEIYAGEV